MLKCIEFTFDNICGDYEKHKGHKSRKGEVVWSRAPVYKMLNHESRLVKNALEAHGFVQTGPHGFHFNLLWTGSHLRPHCLRSLDPAQRVNHFPRSDELSRKDRLALNLLRAQTTHGRTHFDFLPRFFLIPQEREAFRTACEAASPDALFILKPVGSSRGRGIFLTSDAAEVPTNVALLASHYISNPYLVGGRKLDLRLYVVVTSFQPLVAYMFPGGLVRFATEAYDGSAERRAESCVHLTNYSLNRHSDKYRHGEHKWSLAAFLRLLRRRGCPPALLLLRLEDLVRKTLLAAQPSVGAATYSAVPYVANCFELFGFDVLLDADLKPWLLEVNLSPSLTCDTPLDYNIKGHMLCQLLNLIGISKSPDKLQKLAPLGSRESGRRMEKQLERLSAGAVSPKRRTTPQSPAIRAAQAARAHMLKRQRENRTAAVRRLSAGALLEAHAARVSEEEGRAGSFQRLLPSRVGLGLYGAFFEELRVGEDSVAVDADLHRRLYPAEEPPSELMLQVGLELSETKERRCAGDLSPAVRDFLAPELARTAVYEQDVQTRNPDMALADATNRSETVTIAPTQKRSKSQDHAIKENIVEN